MGISTTEQMLLIILSATLAILLVLSIVAMVKAVQILNIVKRITQKAEQIADKAELATDFFSNTSATVAIGKLLSNIFNASKSNKK
jgi:cell division protein FtsL